MREARAQGSGLVISDVTLYELTGLIVRNRIQLQVSLESFIQEVEAKFTVLPITREIAARAWQFPDTYPRDPMDRLIGATAVVHGLPLVTADERIRKSKAVHTIW
jgi:PIN domain nuclease of toxin-antitoxin system